MHRKLRVARSENGVRIKIKLKNPFYIHGQNITSDMLLAGEAALSGYRKGIKPDSEWAKDVLMAIANIKPVQHGWSVHALGKAG